MRSAVVLLALAAVASANPLRLAHDEQPRAGGSIIEMTRAPCHRTRVGAFEIGTAAIDKSSRRASGRLGALLTSLGLTTSSPPHPVHREGGSVRYSPEEPPLTVDDIPRDPLSTTADMAEFERLAEQAMMRFIESSAAPALEGPAGAEETPVFPLDAAASGPVVILHRPAHGPAHIVETYARPHVHGAHPHGHGPHGWHRRPRTFGQRLHRALRSLTPVEALIMAFVIGSGVGSILHFFFMVFLLAVRKFGGSASASSASASSSESRQDGRGALMLSGMDAMVQNVTSAPAAEKEQSRHEELNEKA